MSIFGHLQVLFKVAPKAGQPGAKEEPTFSVKASGRTKLKSFRLMKKTVW